MIEKDEIILEVKNIKKKFCSSLKRSMFYSMLDMFSVIFKKRLESDFLRKEEFFALDNVSFSLKKGESLGLIGLNGCGKSTLLRIIAGIYPPSSGEINVKGKIGALIAVGAGFHDQMSGRDNIYLNGTILGMTKEEIDNKFDKIVEFAELGDFLESPVQTYSSGMRVRLGFSIAVHADIDILIADEVLAVGDAPFKLKCFNKLGELKARGVSIILVSHEIFVITSNCQKGLYLKKGKLEYFGDVYKAAALYNQDSLKGNELLESKSELDKKMSVKDFLIFFPPIEGLTFYNITFDKPFLDGFLEIKTHEDLEISFFYESERDFNGLRVDYTISVDNYTNSAFTRVESNENSPFSLKAGKGIIKLIIKDINLVNSYGRIITGIYKGKKEVTFASVNNLPLKFTSSDRISSYGTLGHFSYKVIISD